MRSVSLQHDWILHADMDEHHVYPRLPITKFLAKCDKKRANVVMGHFRDRVARFNKHACVSIACQSINHHSITWSAREPFLHLLVLISITCANHVVAQSICCFSNGALPVVQANTSLEEQFPFKCHLTEVMLYSSWIASLLFFLSVMMFSFSGFWTLLTWRLWLTRAICSFWQVRMEFSFSF